MAETTVTHLPATAHGWMKRGDLGSPWQDVWELPDGHFIAVRKGKTPLLATLAPWSRQQMDTAPTIPLAAMPADLEGDWLDNALADQRVQAQLATLAAEARQLRIPGVVFEIELDDEGRSTGRVTAHAPGAADDAYNDAINESLRSFLDLEP